MEGGSGDMKADGCLFAGKARKGSVCKGLRRNALTPSCDPPQLNKGGAIALIAPSNHDLMQYICFSCLDWLDRVLQPT